MSINSDISFSGAFKSHYSIIVFTIVILAFILVSLWSDAIQKIYYDMFNHDRNNPLDALFLASLVTVIVFVIMYCLKKSHGD